MCDDIKQFCRECVVLRVMSQYILTNQLIVATFAYSLTFQQGYN